MKEIGENLREQRVKANKSVYDVEKELEINHQNLCRGESGKQEPSIKSCIKLADFYGVSLDELFGREF